MRLGLVGLGPWGRTLASCIADLPDVTLHAVACRQEAAAAAVAPNARWFADGFEMLRDGELDGVVVATPPTAHAEIAIAAIERGVAVFIEKPMATSLADAERIAHAARDKRVVVVVDHIDLFNPAYRSAREAQATCGAIRARSGRLTRRISPRRVVDALWDFAPHLCAMAIDLAGTEPSVTFARRVVASGVDRLLFRLDFPDGTPFRAAAGVGFAADARRARVVAAGATLRYDGAAPGPPGATPLHRALREFVDQVQARAFDARQVLLGRAVVRCLVAIEELLAR